MAVSRLTPQSPSPSHSQPACRHQLRLREIWNYKRWSDQSCPTLQTQPTDLCFVETSWHFTGFLHPAGRISMEFNWLISLESFLKYQRLVFSQHEISFLSFLLLDLHNFHLSGPQLKNSIIHSLQGVHVKHFRNTRANWLEVVYFRDIYNIIT